MAHSTKLSPVTINQQADRHITTKEDIEQQLAQLKVDVDNVLQASTSAATRALSTTTDNWIESLKKSVLAHLEAMAQNIRNEAGNQQSTDETSMNQILNLPMETGNFLGVS